MTACQAEPCASRQSLTAPRNCVSLCTIFPSAAINRAVSQERRPVLPGSESPVPARCGALLSPVRRRSPRPKSFRSFSARQEVGGAVQSLKSATDGRRLQPHSQQPRATARSLKETSKRITCRDGATKQRDTIKNVHDMKGVPQSDGTDEPTQNAVDAARCRSKNMNIAAGYHHHQAAEGNKEAGRGKPIMKLTAGLFPNGGRFPVSGRDRDRLPRKIACGIARRSISWTSPC